MATPVPPTSHPSVVNNSDAETEESILLLRRLLFDSSVRVLFITGAGISVKSGIPLYRSDREKVVSIRSGSTDLSSTGCPEEGEKSDEVFGGGIEEDTSRNADPNVFSTSTTAASVSTNGWGAEVHKEAAGACESKKTEEGEDDDDDDGEIYVAISDDEDIDEALQSTKTVFEPIYQVPVDLKPFGVKYDAENNIKLETKDIKEKIEEDMRSKQEADDDSSSSESHPLAIWDAKLEALCQKQSFLIDPRSWYKYFWFDTHHVNKFLNAVPNESHFAIGLLCDKFRDRVRCVTQNVDGLHQQGGCPLENLIEVHGRIGVYRCCFETCPNGSIEAVYPHDMDFLTPEEEADWNAPLRLAQCPKTRRLFEIEREKSASKPKSTSFPVDEDFPLPCCNKCRSPLLPMTLMFDETYQTHQFFQFDLVCQWMEEADVFVFAGTSFSVFFTEHALHLARFGRKQVFNINISRDEDAFYGFTNSATAVSSVSQDLNSTLSVCFNWDSDVSDHEGEARTPSVLEVTTDAPHEYIGLNSPTINHIVAPADLALTSVLPEAYRMIMHDKVTDARLEKWKRLWDTK